MKNDIPKPTVGRLVKLTRLLEQLEASSSKVVSSADLEKLTGWSRDTIRRDISFLNASCASALGYDVAILREAIYQKLGLPHKNYKCCLVGLGRLGEALIQQHGLLNTSFSIVAGFDSNVNRVEILSAPFPLYTTTRMESVIKEMGIEYAILAVAEQSAQSIAEKLVSFGIKGLVNFTPAVLTIPAKINIENVSVLDALQKLVAKDSILGSKK